MRRSHRARKELRREHREGLIVLSSCLKGEVSQSLAGGNYTKMTGIPDKDLPIACRGFTEFKARGMQVPPPVAAKRHWFS